MRKIRTKDDAQKLHDILDSCLDASASSLAELLHRPVQKHLRSLQEILISDLEHIIPAIQQRVFAVYIKCEGDMRIGALLFLPSTEAKHLAARLLGKKSMKKLTILGRSSIAEMCNITLGSFLNSLCKQTGFREQASVSGFAIDTLRVLLEQPAADIASKAESMVIATTELHTTNNGIKLYLLLMIDMQGAEKILVKCSGDL